MSANVRPLRSARQPDAQVDACPVAQLAAEAAAAVRLRNRLLANSANPDPALIEALSDMEASVQLGEVQGSTFRRLQAIRALAPHRRAGSLKGAIFQIYATGDHVTALSDTISTSNLSAGEQRALEQWREEAHQLLYSVAAVLESMSPDPDLSDLKGWLLPPQFDVGAELERQI